MLGEALLAVALVAAPPAFDDRKFDEVSAKHIGTGVAAGVATMGTCTTYLVLRHRVRRDDERPDQEPAGAKARAKPKSKPWWSTGGCYALTVGLAGAAYGYKEGVYDPQTYGQGKIDGKNRRDFTEGVGGTAMGALVFVPIAAW
jgi:hypothetical protein